MCENGTGHEEARGPTRRRLCCTAFQILSQRERDVKECHRRGSERRISLWRAKDRLACRFRLDGSMEASRLHAAVKSEPICGDHSARRRGTCELFQSQAMARNPTVVDFGALASP